MAVATRFIDTRRSRPKRRADEAQVLHLRHAAQSAGEAFAFVEEFSRTAPSLSYSTAFLNGLARLFANRSS